MIRRPRRSTLFPYRRSSDLSSTLHITCGAFDSFLDRCLEYSVIDFLRVQAFVRVYWKFVREHPQIPFLEIGRATRCNRTDVHLPTQNLTKQRNVVQIMAKF
uniref:Uncharacterized protein n=1 Tax=Cacopsylla melanoneura TaxID=428564 RepID=A0A8D8T7D1_9HEMI